MVLAMASRLAIAVVALALFPACGRKSSPVLAESAPSAAGSAPAPSGSARVPAASDAPAKISRRAQGKCPNWVPGAKTEIEDVEGGVALTVTAGDEAGARQIRERARYLAEKRSKGGDATGQCPVIRDVPIETADVPGGARIVLRPTDALPLAKLRSEARDRLARSLE